MLIRKSLDYILTMIRKVYLIVFIFLAIVSLKLNAQYFHNLDVNNGLSQPSVMAIGQDTLGRMWFGTREGLNVYDGGRITSYKGEVDNGENGKLWIGNSVSYIVSDNLSDRSKIFFISDFFLYSYDVESDLFSRIDAEGDVTAITEYSICTKK
ncbi:Response regulator containing a CheY-like receiver domain and a GGDEF domain [uncultured Bacteroides sp.]|nr:Response regulator containing a CheY-like receiver domain and a GGDEF domain [uncultured Bacteroides sp.]